MNKLLRESKFCTNHHFNTASLLHLNSFARNNPDFRSRSGFKHNSYSEPSSNSDPDTRAKYYRNSNPYFLQKSRLTQKL